MLQVFVPSISTESLPEIRVHSPEIKDRPDRSAAATEPTPKVGYSELLEAIDEAGNRLSQARGIVSQAYGREQELESLLQTAESRAKTHELRVLQLEGQVAYLEQKVPRWVRRFFGAV